jgi:steroid 5-alpha reductase family enzyme
MVWVLSAAVLILMTAVMLCAWGYGLARRNGGWTDAFWVFGSGVALAGAVLFPLHPHLPPQPRQWLVAGLVALWAARLGWYIAVRVAGHAQEDSRYAKFRADWGKDYPRNMLFVTLPQAPATALLGLSVLIAARTPGALGPRDLLGVAILLIAIGGEALADNQMKRFKADPAHKGKVADTGLWGWSRHPNYFFEWLGWLAYPAIGLNPGQPMTWLSFVGAAVMFLLLTRISGIPPLEETQLASKGEAYRAYQRRVSAFFPLPPKQSAKSS